MYIYTSVYCLIKDYFEFLIHINNPKNLDQFMYCFLFSEYYESFWFDIDKIQFVELASVGCPEFDQDFVYSNVDNFLELLLEMQKRNLVIHLKRQSFRFPWQEKTFYNTSWEQYEDFFIERVGIPVTFDKTLPPYFTLALQLKELDVGFVLK